MNPAEKTRDVERSRAGTRAGLERTSRKELGGRRYGSYLAVIVGLETIVFSAAVLVVELQAEPVLGTVRRVAPFLNTTRGEAFVSVLVALFLFCMGAFGIAMGVILFFTVVLNAYVYVAHPEAVADRADDPDAEGGAASTGAYAPPFDDSPFAAPPPTQPSTADL